MAEKAVTSALRVTAEVLNEIGAINNQVTVNVLSSSDFLVVRSAIMLALKSHPDARRDVADALAQIEQPQVIEAQPC